MDQIAASLGISKRTLYEVFPDKETLLEECILKSQKDGDIFVKENNDIIAKKEGVSKIVLKHKIQNLKKSITVKVNKKVIEKVITQNSGQKNL